MKTTTVFIAGLVLAGIAFLAFKIFGGASSVLGNPQQNGGGGGGTSATANPNTLTAKPSTASENPLNNLLGLAAGALGNILNPNPSTSGSLPGNTYSVDPSTDYLNQLEDGSSPLGLGNMGGSDPFTYSPVDTGDTGNLASDFSGDSFDTGNLASDFQNSNDSFTF